MERCNIKLEESFIQVLNLPFRDYGKLVVKRDGIIGTGYGIYEVFLDKLVGGVGTRRGGRSNIDLRSGDALDFWRVLIADKKNNRLLLYAEMKLPGEAWLEFHIVEKNGKKLMMQTATFRPNGLWGRLYWYAMWPFHLFIFNGMAKEIAP